MVMKLFFFGFLSASLGIAIKHLDKTGEEERTIWVVAARSSLKTLLPLCSIIALKVSLKKHKNKQRLLNYSD